MSFSTNAFAEGCLQGHCVWREDTTGYTRFSGWSSIGEDWCIYLKNTRGPSSTEKEKSTVCDPGKELSPPHPSGTVILDFQAPELWKK